MPILIIDGETFSFWFSASPKFLLNQNFCSSEENLIVKTTDRQAQIYSYNRQIYI